MKIVCKYSGISFCVFYTENNNISFPSNDWTDFSVNIISDWIAMVVSNEHKRNTVFNLFFVDGPYYLRCEKNENQLKITGIDDHNESEVFCEKILFDDIKYQLYNVATSILKFNSSNVPMSEDLILLKQNCAQLKLVH